MRWELLVSLVVGMVPALVTWIVYRQAGRANKITAEQAAVAAVAAHELEQSKVDAAAIVTAQQIYQRGIAEAERQLDQVRTDYAQVTAETRQLRRRVAALEEIILTAGLPLPNG